MRTPPHEPVASDISEAASGRGHKASAPERRCILSGETAPKDGLIRLAISPEGDVLPDPLARAPGRGAWLGVSRTQLDEAIAAGKLRGALARAFKGAQLSVPDNLPQLVETALVKLLADRLGLEMRAGKLILGSDRIAEHARSGRVSLLLHASDAGEDGSKKLDQAWRVGRDAEGTGQRGTVLPLDRAALSVALGRDNVVHMALADENAAERVQAVLMRLLHFLRADAPVMNGGEARNASAVTN
ncbi:DUF448 domain-containing protein [Pontixanthobacter aquaemixtae]|uniref:DUF448 domain-containing protein n=1 Tax=Pontixanthobacter aquaemixtae TaxID=1958940 RepID=A0A844ZUH3_9SPHN|nr:DUF448 domain-containing protein [Pontixanthobacter aquaemixtae]MXO90932.1 DUF448 domain-containing protein [Pontixanthobacter aquaemixtae]